MKRYLCSYAVAAICSLSLPAFSQSVADSTLLGLPGDNLDLYAVLDLFQQSKTIEDFEKSLNLEKTGINNMDLDLDKKVDFIKVVTKQDKDDFTFILQIAVSKTETQDVAVILVSKDDNKKITMQIVGDEDLYGKNYIVELKETSTPAVTANPGYKGPDTVKVVTVPAKTTTVIVEQVPVVQYVYSPAYVPYVPPYYYGYYPPYFAAFSVMAIGFYWGSHAHYHGGYGYHGNTVVIHNHNNYNNYNRTRNTSNTVNNNMARGDYSRNNSASTRPTTRESGGAANRGGASTRPSAGTQPAGGASRPSGGASPSTREAGGASTRPSAGTTPSTREAGGAGPTREAAGMSNRQSGGSSPQARPSSNGASRYSSGGGASRGTSGYSGGGHSRGGSGFSGGGGGSRGGGGRRR
jgi:hypothetical protein